MIALRRKKEDGAPRNRVDQQTKNGCERAPFRGAIGHSDGRRAKRSAKRAVKRGDRVQQACASLRTRKSNYPCPPTYPIGSREVRNQGSKRKRNTYRL